MMKGSFFYMSVMVTFLSSHTCAQQNLILNGGFEEHRVQTCLECNTLYGQYPSLVSHWDNGGWACRLCDKDYKQTSDEKKWKVCPMDRISPCGGKAMIEMIYSPGVNGMHGGASHLTARSMQTLEVGHLYEVTIFRLWTPGIAPNS
jgi:hypothetical protein